MFPHLPRPLSRLGVVVTAGVFGCGALLAVAGGTASAHVTVASADAAPGGYGKVTFRVPNESPAASTVDVRIQLPTDTPLTSVRAQPVPGWTIIPTSTELPPAVQGGGEVTSAVSVVEFRADAGNGIGPGEFQEFALSGGPFPDAKTLPFNVVQDYSDGTEVAWIEPSIPGQAEPAHPAPVLSLSADGGSATPAATSPSNGGTDGLAVIALVVGALGLVAGLAGLGLALAARRRTVSS